MAKKPAMPKALKRFAGRWRITALDNFDTDLDEAPAKCELKTTGTDGLEGSFQIDDVEGSLNGNLRAFGGESIVVFHFEASDGMHAYSGVGWLRLTGGDALEGELLGDGDLGRFTADRA